MMTMAMLLGLVLGLLIGWLLTAASAAATLRRKNEEWTRANAELQADLAALLLERAGKTVERDPMCPPGMVYLVHGKRWTKTGGDAA